MKKIFFAIFAVVAMVGGIVLGTGAFNEAKALNNMQISQKTVKATWISGTLTVDCTSANNCTCTLR